MLIFARIVKKFYGAGVIVIAVARNYAGMRIWRKRKMKKIKAHCGIGFAGAVYDEEFEFKDDVTDDEIDDEIQEWAEQFLEVWWEETK